MIYADENVWRPVVEGLRRRGWSVTTAADEATLGAPDHEQLRYAAAREWPLLTFDDDFLALVESGSIDFDHAGVIYASQHRRSVGDLVRRIDSTLQRTRNRNLAGEVVYA